MSTHKEFPAMTPAAQAAAVRSLGHSIDNMDAIEVHRPYRRALAAFLREAMQQADKGSAIAWLELEAIAASLHSPPPPPPTLADARAADLSTPEGRDVVSAFLATLGRGEQP